MTTSQGRIWALGIALLLSAVTTTGGARPGQKISFQARTPGAPAISGKTGGVVALKAPPPSEIKIGGGPFEMGSTLAALVRIPDLCKRDAKPGACDLPMARETILHGGLDVHLEDLIGNEMVPHQVHLSPYWIDQHEVSVKEYLRCVEVGRCRKPPYDEGAKRFAKPSYPISYVSWEDARLYCTWRGKRLPTEAEWERAARGAEGRIFPWGNLYNRRLSNQGILGTTYLELIGHRSKVSTVEPDARDGFLELAPIRSFPDGRTPDGIDDLAGNVAEWVQDFYEPRYRPEPAQDPQGPLQSQSPFRVIRGGSYLHSSPWLRSTARLMASPEERRSWIGFRCARGD